MHPHRLVRLATISSVIALAIAVVPVGSANAAPGDGWNIGDCFAKADVDNDIIELGSAVACAKPHAVQILGGASLPSSLTRYTYKQLRDQGNTSIRASLTKFSEQTCSGERIAGGIWPAQGAAVAKALTGLARNAAGGVLPGLSGAGIANGWVFPDAAAFRAGDRSMICVMYKQKPPVDAPASASTVLTGDAQLLGTSRTLPKLRACFAYDPSDKTSSDVSCARAHTDELIAHFLAKLPVAVADMTDAQWAVLDKQCDAIVDALVGANRSDLRSAVNAEPGTKPKTPTFIPCYVSRPTSSDGTVPNLPAGTVVGLGKKALTAA